MKRYTVTFETTSGTYTATVRAPNAKRAEQVGALRVGYPNNTGRVTVREVSRTDDETVEIAYSVARHALAAFAEALERGLPFDPTTALAEACAYIAKDYGLDTGELSKAVSEALRREYGSLEAAAEAAPTRVEQTQCAHCGEPAFGSAHCSAACYVEGNGGEDPYGVLEGLS